MGNTQHQFQARECPICDRERGVKRSLYQMWTIDYNAPEKVTNAANLSCAEREIKKYCKLLEL